MPIAVTLNPGTFRDGSSYLHRFDPRLKLLLLCGVMSCVFSAGSGWRLLPLALLWLVAAKFCSNGWRDGLKVFRLLRWLLLFTLLLHLFFTPGRTLFGTSWLSFDGLLRGLLVDGQLLLAVLFSMLLAWTTRPELLAWGLASLLSPFQYFKVPVREAGGLLFLVLQFFPVIQDEITQQLGTGTRPLRSGLAGIKDRACMIVPLLMRLIERADLLATDIAAGKGQEAGQEFLAARSFTRFDCIGSVVCLVLLLLISLV